MRELRDVAISDLNITLTEFYDKTIYELSIELQGYNSRWEEAWRHTRLICTFFYNSNPGEAGPLKPYQVMPLPSESLQVALDEYSESLAFEATMAQENER